MPFKRGHPPYNGTQKTRFKKGQIAWNKQNNTKFCLSCKNEFFVIKSLTNTKKFCSKKCYTNYQKQNPNLGSYKKGHVGLKGKNNGWWKGNNVTYHHLHEWVNLYKGKANKCEHCNTKSNKRYEWANKSHQYKRDINDWISLCKKCHSKYDNVGPKISKSLKKYHANNTQLSSRSAKSTT